MGRTFPTKVKSAAYARCGGHCESDRCGHSELVTGHFRYDHRIPWEFSKDSSLTNCQVLCDACDCIKTNTLDIPAIAKSTRVRDRHIGAHQPRRPLPCGRRSVLSKPVSGAPKPRRTLSQKLQAAGIIKVDA